MRMRLLPQRPYRCLHCYHRFWHRESFFADRRRVWTWSIIVLVVMLLLIPRGDSSMVDTKVQLKQRQPDTTAGVPRTVSSISNTEETASEEIKDSAAGKLAIVPDSASARELVQDLGFIAPDEQSKLADNLSDEELQREVERARNKAHSAARNSEQRRSRLQQELRNDPAERESLLKIDINFVIEQWRSAWERGDTARYLGYYSEKFVPGDGNSREAWRRQRTARIYPDRQIELKLSGFEVNFADNYQRSSVVFKQHYQSGGFAEDSRKELILELQDQEWKIVSERELD